ncbi:MULTISPECIES: methyltransferase domain-containing protein [unclassified Endozoicomonas]|uniref:methyltransferase domain-containing protein n=1 Tax=unclassified Endozoicomonas TaxID=2644528 RepID=UPI003BB50D22
MNPLNTSSPTYKPDPVSLNQEEDGTQARATVNTSPIVESEKKALHDYDVRKSDSSKNIEHSQLRDPDSSKEINKVFRQLAAQGEFGALIAHMKKNSDVIDINGTSSNGNTALHWASQGNHRAVVKELLSQPEINITAVNLAGKTPAQITTDQNLAAIFYAASHLSSSIAHESVLLDDITGEIYPDLMAPAGIHQSIWSIRSEKLSLHTMQQRFKISEDFFTILKELHPHVPEKGQIVELACGASHSAVRYHQLYGQDVHFFGIDDSPKNIQESEYYAERLKSHGLDLQFHVGSPSDPDHAWPKAVDLCVLRNSLMADTSRLQKIINTAADQCNQLLITSFNNSSLEKIIALANNQFTVEKKIHKDGHVPWPELGAFDSSAALLKRR